MNESQNENIPKGFIFEVTVTRRYFVPMSGEIAKYLGDKAWETDSINGHHYGILTEEQSRQNTYESIYYRLLEGINHGDLFTEDDQEILDHIDKTKQFVSDVESEEWESQQIVMDDEDPAKLGI